MGRLDHINYLVNSAASFFANTDPSHQRGR